MLVRLFVCISISSEKGKSLSEILHFCGSARENAKTFAIFAKFRFDLVREKCENLTNSNKFLREKRSKFCKIKYETEIINYDIIKLPILSSDSREVFAHLIVATFLRNYFLRNFSSFSIFLLNSFSCESL